MTLEFWNSLFWFALGLLVCYGASRLGIGSATDPGSGFIFFWSGLILTLLSIMLVADSFRRRSVEAKEIQRTNWVTVSLVLASLVFYALFLERLGFVVTTFVLLGFLLRLSEETTWPRVLGVAIAAALGSYAVFELWLGIRLPKGIFGF